MSSSADALYQRLAQIEQMPYGPARSAEAERAVADADALGQPDLRFDARMRLTTAYVEGGTSGKAFATFAWCLADFDRSPGRHDEHAAALLRWHYKWIIAMMTRFPQITLAQARDGLADMERRYLEGGHSLHAVHALRWRIADHLGDRPAAAAAYELWRTAPRDENSDCAGCDPAAQSEQLVLEGRDVEAIELCQPALVGDVGCPEQPANTLVALLRSYLRLGRLDEARSAHRRAYATQRTSRDCLGDIAGHLEFCRWTVNDTHGATIAVRHLGWYDDPNSPHAAMHFAAAASAVLRAAADAGDDAELLRPGTGDHPSRTMTRSALAVELAAEARALGQQFDVRNATTHQSEIVETILAATPLVDWLPLTPTAEATAATAERHPAALAPKPEPERVGAELRASAPPAPTSTLLDEAEEAWVAGRRWGAITAWRRAFERPAANPREALRLDAGRAIVAGLCSEDDDGSDEDAATRAAWQALVDASEADRVGLDELRARLTYAVALTLVRQQDPIARAVIAAALDVAGDRMDRAAPLLALRALASMIDGDHELAREELASARTAADRADGVRATLLVGQLALHLGRTLDPGPDSLETELAGVVALRATAEAGGREGDALQLGVTQSYALGELGRLDEAVAVARDVAEASRSFDPLLHARAMLALTRALNASETAGVDDVLAAVVAADRVGLPRTGAETRLALGRVLLVNDRAEEAAAVLEEAAQLVAGNPGWLGQAIAATTAQAYRRTGDLGAALEALGDCLAWNAARRAELAAARDGATGAPGGPDPQADELHLVRTRAGLTADAAELLDASGRSGEAVERWTEAITLHRLAGDEQYALVCRRMGARSVGRGDLGRAIELLTVLRADLGVSPQLEHFDLELEIACTDDDLSYCLWQADRNEMALPVAREARDRLARLGHLGVASSVALRVAQIHVELDDGGAEAAARQALALANEDGDPGAQLRALFWFADLLDRLDRPDEARDARAEAERIHAEAERRGSGAPAA